MKRQVVRKCATLSATVQDLISKEGVEVDREDHDLFKKVMEKKDSAPFQENTPQWLLWEQQKEQAMKKIAEVCDGIL